MLRGQCVHYFSVCDYHSHMHYRLFYQLQRATRAIVCMMLVILPLQGAAMMAQCPMMQAAAPAMDHCMHGHADGAQQSDQSNPLEQTNQSSALSNGV